MIQRARAGVLRTLLARDPVLIGRQLHAPLGLALAHWLFHPANLLASTLAHSYWENVRTFEVATAPKTQEEDSCTGECMPRAMQSRHDVYATFAIFLESVVLFLCNITFVFVIVKAIVLYNFCKMCENISAMVGVEQSDVRL
jgi:hypothetical protein